MLPLTKSLSLSAALGPLFSPHHHPPFGTPFASSSSSEEARVVVVVVVDGLPWRRLVGDVAAESWRETRMRV